MHKKIGDQQNILEMCHMYLPQKAVIYLLDSRAQDYAAYFLNEENVKQVYVFETKNMHNKKIYHQLKKVTYIKPIWEKNRFMQLKNGKEVEILLEDPDMVHISEHMFAAGMLAGVSAILKTARPIVWIEQSLARETRITNWMYEHQYVLQQKVDHHAIYVCQEKQKNELSEMIGQNQKQDLEEKKRLEQNILELVEISKKQMEQAHAVLNEKFIQQEKALTKAIEQQALLKKAHQKECDRLKRTFDEKITALGAQHAQALAEQNKRAQQLQSELHQSKDMVQLISDALNAEKAVNYDLNKRLFDLLDEELPILQDLDRCSHEQDKEIKKLQTENKKLARKLAVMTEKYHRLNKTKVIKLMRRYWYFKNRRRLRKKREEN
ncbi:hypothetical protein [Listeria ilorinensis]|uniref:hypothetical protein n=1 Tax=Listeria ilorinensis TaxID=2867439 RepID=UPI001EF5F6D0|nr:hypothetical protein [Listeria ilorinensis]